MMGEMAKKIVINDLLSFLTCKNHLAPREKLLNTISEYYSEEAIAEAQRALLSALPVKKSTRHGRRVKHPDPLVVIYDCIQLIPKDDLPIFVCKNLNNVPNLNNIKEMTLKMEEEENFEDQAVDEAEAESNDNEIDEALWRKEQKLMRSQISEMFSIITELRDGLHRYYTQNKRIGPKTEIIENKRTSKNGNYYSESESNPVISKFQSAEDESCNQSDSDDDTSELDGLALLQKLIDEDDQNIEMDTVDKEDSYNSEEDPGNRDEFDMKENLGTSDYPQMEVNKTENYAKLSQSSVKGVSLPSKKPTVVVTPSENGHKVIYIRSDLEERGANSAGVDAPPLNSDMETPIEISTTSDYISQIEIGATSHPSHQKAFASKGRSSDEAGSRRSRHPDTFPTNLQFGQLWSWTVLLWLKHIPWSAGGPVYKPRICPQAHHSCLEERNRNVMTANADALRLHNPAFFLWS